MTFAEQAAELAKLEAVAKSLGMSAAAFERIAIDVTQEAHLSSVERRAYGGAGLGRDPATR